MIDDLAHQLDSLAATIDGSIDLPSLRRRLSGRARRRTVLRVSVAVGGLAAIVGGLVVLGEVRHSRTTAVPAADQTTKPSTVPTASSVPDCAPLLAAQRSGTGAATAKAGAPATDTAGDRRQTVDFKGVVSIISIDGSTLTVSGGASTSGSAESRKVVLDPTTAWENASVALIEPAALHAGETVGVAALTASDGVEHAVVVDIGVTNPVAAPSAPADKSVDRTKPSTSIVLPGPSLSPGPTDKSFATITAVTNDSITVTLQGAEQGKTTSAAIAGTTFYVDDTVCRPTGLAVGSDVGIAYHLDAAGTVVADAILLLS